METLQSLHDLVRSKATDSKKDLGVVGTWIRLNPQEPSIEYLIIQKDDQTAELIQYAEDGKPTSVKGKIVFERAQTGYPVRKTTFIPDPPECGLGKITIDIREF